MKENTYMKPWDGVFYGNEYQDEELRHTYWLKNGKKNKQYFGITTVVGWALPSYSGVGEQTLKAAASFGGDIHDEIEAYEEFGGEPDTQVLKMYQQCKDENKIHRIANEFLVSDGKQFASAIDMVADTPECEDNEVILIDFKTTADRLEEKVALQLSFYAEWFEKQTGLKVRGLYHMWFKKEKVDGEPVITSVEYNEVERVASLRLLGVLKAYKRNTKYEKVGKLLVPQSQADLKYTYDPYPRDLHCKARKVSELNLKLLALNAELEQAKAALMEEMATRGFHTIKNQDLTLSRMAGRLTTRFDKKKLLADHPEIDGSLYETKSISKESLTLRYNTK